MPGLSRLATAVAAAAVLTACAGAPSGPRSGGAAPPAQDPSPSDVAAATANSKAVPGVEAAAKAQEARLAPPMPPEARPAELQDLSDEEVRGLIGAPAFARTDDPAALWQYRAEGCLLDVYLYAAGGTYRVRHFEFRPDPRTGAEPGALVDAVACYAALRARQAKGGARS